MTLYAGIDGGQSATIAEIGDATQTIARGTAPAADLVGEPRDSARQVHALNAALDAVLAAAGLPADSRFANVVAGISGFDEGLSSVPHLRSRSDRARIVHDTEIAHAGALGGAPGIVVIAGTGSVALGTSEAGGAALRAGGWGYFFGDEGSAIWIARTALGHAMASEDRDERSELARRAVAFFGVPSLRHVQHAFAHGELTRPQLASFAREILACARAGDADAVAVRDEAAACLTRLCRNLDRRLAPATPRRVSYAGGVFSDDAFAALFASHVARGIPGATVDRPLGDAVSGALTLARRG